MALEEIQHLAGLRSDADLLDTTALLRPELLRKVGQIIVNEHTVKGLYTQESIEVRLLTITMHPCKAYAYLIIIHGSLDSADVKSESYEQQSTTMLS